MTHITLVPEWQTSQTPTAIDGQLFVCQLHAPLVGNGSVVIVDETPIEVSLNLLASTIDSVWIDNVRMAESDIVRSARTLTITPYGISNGLKTIYIVSRSIPNIEILYGSLPTGMVLSQNTITGSPFHLERVEYPVMFRASYQGEIRDRLLTIPAQLSPVVVPEWIGFPVETIENGIAYHSLASLELIQSFIQSYEMAQSDQYTKPVIIPVAIPELPDFIAGLPSGLRLDGPTIKGTVSLDATVGKYLFYMAFDGHGLTNALLCSFEIKPEIWSAGGDIQDILWVTPEGLLGTLESGQDSTLSVVAQRGDNEVVYTTALGGLVLPYGLVLTLNGEIRGTAPHVNQRTVYRFRVKAASGNVYTERVFEIVIQNTKGLGEKYGTSELRLGKGTRDIYLTKYKGIISQSDLYRPDDIRFGMREKMPIYVISGFAPESIEDVVRDPIRKYERPIKLRLGKHISKPMYNGNTHICDFIYREIIDEQDDAGGFMRGTEDVVEERIPWIRPPAPQGFVYPVSIRNYRHDIVDHLGMSTNKPEYLRRIGKDSAEVPPLWQWDDDYIAGMEVAYVLPTRGPTLAMLLDRLNGFNEVSIFRYFSSIRDDSIRGVTTFDGGTTLFDGDTGVFIRFDAIDNTELETIPTYGWNDLEP